MMAAVLFSLLAQADDWRVVCEQDGRIVEVPFDGKEIRNLSQPRPSGSERLSPDGKRRVYVRTEEDDAEIWVSDADGKNPKKLTDNRAIDNMPDWSSDGKKVVFASTREGDWQIWIMDADGANPTQLTRHKEGAWEPRFSPVGNRIAYRARTNKPQKLPPSDLIVMNVDGSDSRVIVSNDAVLDHAWDPKGKRLAYSLVGTLAIYDLDKQAAVRTVDFKSLDAGLHSHGAWNIVWRPDGAALACQITFLGGRKAGTVVRGDNELFVVPVEGEVRKLEFGAPTRPLRWVK